MLYVLDKNKKVRKIKDVLRWAKWMKLGEAHSARIVGCTILPEGTVSTVFMGLDYSFGSGKPTCFETMIFGDFLCENENIERYATWEEAIRGHRRWVARLKRSAVKKVDKNNDTSTGKYIGNKR